MDPNANLKEQLEIAKKISDLWAVDPTAVYDPDEVERLANLVLALDEWIMKGGFLPEEWCSVEVSESFTPGV